MTTYTTEMFLRVYNDRTGEYVEVRPDRDSLGLVEIIEPGSKNGIIIHPAMAGLLADAIRRVAEDLSQQKASACTRPISAT